ncbi:hypothetical protein [Hyphomicrobium sp. 2TAF46]|uniref:hypothetical protein n=1 Tax=Hyphomicrobium sp. 2TAF46 TaxID=3233019 RepID=UPI003F936E49
MKAAERRGFTNGYTLAMPGALADPRVNIFDMLDALAPREPDVLPRGRRREVGKNVRNADPHATVGAPDSRDRAITSDGDSLDPTITGVVDRCDPRTVTGVIVGSPDSSTDLSEEEEVSSLAGAREFSFFAPREAPMEIPEEVAPSPIPPPEEGYTTLVYASRVSATCSGLRDLVTDDLVQAFAEITAWLAPGDRPDTWVPQLDLDLARRHLDNVLVKADPASDPDDRQQALREAVSTLREKLDDAEVAHHRGLSSANIGHIQKPIPYLAKTFMNRLREIPIERHKDQLATRNATLKARVEAETEIEIGQKKITAFNAAVEQHANARQKIADNRAARAGEARSAKAERRAYGVIECDDGSKTFDPYARVMTVHRTDVGGNDAIEIMGSFDGATVDDVIKALRRVQESDKPSSNGKSGYFDPMPVNKVVALAKKYLPAITLHRLHGAPESFVVGPVAMKSDLVAISQSWLDELKRRLPDLSHVNVDDGVRALGLPSEIISGSKAFLSGSVESAVFKIAAFTTSSRLETYGLELNRQVEAEMEALLSRINELGRTKREASEAERGRAAERASMAPSPQPGNATRSIWQNWRHQISNSDADGEIIH